MTMLVALIACGKKGPLYLPDPPAQQSAAPTGTVTLEQAATDGAPVAR